MHPDDGTCPRSEAVKKTPVDGMCPHTDAVLIYIHPYTLMMGFPPLNGGHATLR